MSFVSRVGLVIGFFAILLIIACEDVESDAGFIEDISSNDENNQPEKNAVPLEQGSLPLQSLVESSSPPSVQGCGDGVCQPQETKCTCPVDCGQCGGDAQNLTEFRCVDQKCKIVNKQNVCGNGVCELGESSGSCQSDCPICESDNNPCTKDDFDQALKTCVHDPVIPCCGNKVCEPPGEVNFCLIDCKVSNLSLRDYPNPFVVNKKVNTFIVIGSQGTGSSVTSGIDIIRGWEYNGSNERYDTKARLDKELESLVGKNVILIGNACENTHVHSLMKPVRDCRDGLEPGVGLLRLYQTGPESYALVVAGFGSEEIRHAARVLEKYKDYGLTGYQVEVR